MNLYSTFIICLALFGALWLARAVYRFRVSPDAAMKGAKHHVDQYGPVMAGRYGFIALILIGAAFTANGYVVAYVFACLSALGFYDAGVYYRVGRPTSPHLKAGVMSLFAAGLSLIAACLDTL